MNTNYTVNVLDHGFVKLRNIAGPTRRPDALFDASDVDPANSARMSFGETDSGRTFEQEIKLARYLIKHEHWTPVEMIEVWLEMKLPIFVARQFVRHRTVSLNEISGRYVQLPAEWYIPNPSTVGFSSESKKQGRDEGENPKAKLFIQRLEAQCQATYADYQWAIENNIPMEEARLFLHLNHYTHWLMKIDLRNLMHFLKLRDHSHAQYEAAQYAKAVDQLVTQQLPSLMNLYREYVRYDSL